jgi:hypothetical protein
METIEIQQQSLRHILLQLLEEMDGSERNGQLHLGHARQGNNPDVQRKVLGLRVLGLSEHFLPAVLKAMGIRNITFDQLTDPRPILSLNKVFQDNTNKPIAELIANQEALMLLGLFFKNCRTIAFDDWVGSPMYPMIWQLLLDQVIAPLGKQQLDFIFYLGDPRSHQQLELAEVIGLMRAFSNYGKVTLALEETEALSLLELLYPMEKSQNSHPSDPFLALWQVLGISGLLIYSTQSARLLSTDLQLVLSRRHADIAVERSADARDHFIAGYASGLLKEMDQASSLALGLAVFGSNGEQSPLDEHNRLPEYLRRWITAL